MARTLTLTTGEVARHCEVSTVTVGNWIRRRQLPASRTPGGHCRVAVADFEVFLARHGMRPYRRVPERTQRVLVVDDDPAVLATVAGLLRKGGGYEVATASDGFEAGIAMPLFRPDLVVLDLFMPQLDGFKVCRMLKSSPETAAVKVLVVTGYPEPENLQKAREAGADGVIVKPLRLGELREVVERMVGGEVGRKSREGAGGVYVAVQERGEEVGHDHGYGPLLGPYNR